MRLYHDIASASIMFAEVLHNNNQWRDGAQYSVHPSAIFIMFFARIYLEIQYYGYQCNKSK